MQIFWCKILQQRRSICIMKPRTNIMMLDFDAEFRIKYFTVLTCLIWILNTMVALYYCWVSYYLCVHDLSLGPIRVLHLRSWPIRPRLWTPRDSETQLLWSERESFNFSHISKQLSLYWCQVFQILVSFHLMLGKLVMVTNVEMRSLKFGDMD